MASNAPEFGGSGVSGGIDLNSVADHGGGGVFAGSLMNEGSGFVSEERESNKVVVDAGEYVIDVDFDYIGENFDFCDDKMEGFDRFPEEIVVSTDVAHVVDSSVVNNGIAATDGVVEVKMEEAPKKRGRGRPRKTEKKVQENIGRFEDNVVVKEDVIHEIGSVVVENGVSAADGVVEVKMEETPKKRGRGRPPKSGNKIQVKSFQVPVRECSERRKRGRPSYIASEDYEYDSADDEKVETVERNSTKRPQLGNEEKTHERDAAAEGQEPLRRKRGRPRRVVVENAQRASYSFPFQDEEKVCFAVYDLVWAKGKSHSWWPGQILDASKMDLDTQKKGQFLVAYFGDNTFEWCDESDLKTFQSNFMLMEKQKYTDSFQTAVGVALEDVSRCVRFAMTCNCYRGGAYTSPLNQKLMYFGINEDTCLSAGRESRIINTFDSSKLIEYLHLLSVFPNEGGNRLDLAIVTAQVDAFHHSKGYLDRPIYFAGEGVVHGDQSLPSGKEKSDRGFLDPLEQKTSHFTMREDILKDGAGSSVTGKLEHVTEYVIPPMLMSEAESLKRNSVKKNWRRADCINDPRYATEISRATSVLKKYPLLNDLLSDLRWVAANPLDEHDFLSRVNDFFSAFKNCVASTSKDEKPVDMFGSRSTRKITDLNSEWATDSAGYVQDSYWSDLIISDY